MGSVDLGPFAAEALKIAAAERQAAELAARQRQDMERRRPGSAPAHGYCSDRSCKLHHHDPPDTGRKQAS